MNISCINVIKCKKTPPKSNNLRALLQHSVCWISLLHLHMYCIIAWANPRRTLTWWACSLLHRSVGLIKFMHFIKPILKAHGNFQLFLSSWKKWTFSTRYFCICATRNKSNVLLYSILSLAAICFLLYPFPPVFCPLLRLCLT